MRWLILLMPFASFGQVIVTQNAVPNGRITSSFAYYQTIDSNNIFGTTYGPPIKEGDTVICRTVIEPISESITFKKTFCINFGKPTRDTIWTIDTVYVHDTIYIDRPTNPQPETSKIRFKSTHFSTHLEWDSVPGANFYTVIRDGKRLADITSCDTWDGILEPNTTYNYNIAPWDTTGKAYNIISGSLTTLKDLQVITIAGEENLYNRLIDAMNQPNVTTIHLNGIMHGPPIRINKPRLLLTGQLRFGQDQIPNQQFIIHEGGVLGLSGTFLGPNSYPVRVKMARPNVIMYSRDHESASTCELHLSGTFGDSTDYQKGWVNIARNIRGNRTTGKDLIAAYNATIAAGEAFELRPYANQIRGGNKEGIVSPDYGKRFLLRNVRVIGSSFRKNGGPAVGQVTRQNDSLALIVVDSTRYPSFSFNEFNDFSRNSQFVVFKNPLTPQGALNRFENSNIRPVWYRLSNYRALVPITYQWGDATQFTPKMIFGPVQLYNSPGMHPPLAVEGHFLYTQSTCEIEVENVHLKGLYTLFIRSSDAPEFKGPGHNQLSINNVTFTKPVDNWADYIYKFGGYIQAKDFHAGPGIELDVPGPVGCGLMLNVKTMVRRNNVKVWP